VASWQKAVENIPKRHPAEPFDALAQELDQLKTSLMSVDLVVSIAAELKNESKEYFDERLKSWWTSVVKFVAEFKSKFSSYRDVTLPILAAVADVMAAMNELKTRRIGFSDSGSVDKLRYLLLEVDTLPDKNLDVVLTSGNVNRESSVIVDVVRDLGRSWLLSQQDGSAEDNPAENKSAPRSVVFHFRDAEEPEETAGQCHHLSCLKAVHCSHARGLMFIQIGHSPLSKQSSSSPV